MSRPFGNGLKLMKTLSNGEKYLALQSPWFQEFLTDSRHAV